MEEVIFFILCLIIVVGLITIIQISKNYYFKRYNEVNSRKDKEEELNNAEYLKQEFFVVAINSRYDIKYN